MQVKVVGDAYRLDRREIPQALKFFMSCLVDEEVYEDLEVRVVCYPHLLKGEGFLARCYCDSWFNDPRQFTLEIDPMLKRPMFVKVLGHECVHIKQWAKGELSIDNALWVGKQVDAELDYYNLPWENEALARESALFYRYEKERQRGQQRRSRERFSFS